MLEHFMCTPEFLRTYAPAAFRSGLIWKDHLRLEYVSREVKRSAYSTEEVRLWLVLQLSNRESVLWR
jgi:hypothetical protein